jgi:hypothetical protein
MIAETRLARSSLAASCFAAIVLSCSLFKPVVKESYEKDGLAFTHLSSWQIKNDAIVSAAAQVRMVTIEGPSHTVLLLTRFASSNPITLKKYAQTFEDKRAEEIKKQLGGVIPLNADPSIIDEAHGDIGGKQQTGIRQSFNVDVLGVKTPMQADFFMIDGSPDKWILMMQAPTNDWDSIKGGVQTIYDTLAFGTDRDGTVK